MSELPDGWRRVPLRELASISGGLTKGKQRRPGDRLVEVPYLRVANVQRGSLDLAEMKLIEATEAEVKQLQLLPGDVLFNEGGDRDKLGRGCVWNGELPVCIHQNHVFRARVGPDADPHYISMYGNSAEAQRYFLAGGKQTTNLASINLTTLGNLPVLLPPLAEQRRIVKKVGTLRARSGRAREALDSIPALLEKLRQSILAAAFRGDLTKDWRANHPDVEPATELLERIRVERRKKWEEAELAKMVAKGKPPKDDRWKAKYEEPKPVDTTGLPELPEGWCWASVDELLAEGLANGRSVPTADSGFPVLRLTALRDGQILLRERKGGAWTRAEAAPFLVRRGDFLVSRGNGSLSLVGRGGLVGEDPDEVAFPDTLIRFRLNEGVLVSDYLVAVWHSYDVRRQIETSAKTTAGIYKVSQGDLETIVLPVPSVAEQAEIAARIRALELPSRELAGSFLARLDGLERSMLAKAFRGELVPRDRNHHPPGAAPLPTATHARPARSSSRPRGAGDAAVESATSGVGLKRTPRETP